MDRDTLFKELGYYGFIYLILLAGIVIGYPLAKQYATPIAALIFPINDNNSMMKSVIVMSLMYWAMVAASKFILNNKKPPQ